MSAPVFFKNFLHQVSTARHVEDEVLRALGTSRLLPQMQIHWYCSTRSGYSQQRTLPVDLRAASKDVQVIFWDRNCNIQFLLGILRGALQDRVSLASRLSELCRQWLCFALLSLLSFFSFPVWEAGRYPNTSNSTHSLTATLHLFQSPVLPRQLPPASASLRTIGAVMLTESSGNHGALSTLEHP